jgi:copper homeostasis protein
LDEPATEWLWIGYHATIKRMIDAVPPVLLEVCVGSVADAAAAIREGADRLELCGGLELGGLTPSLGLVETALAVSSVPVVVMLRPRAGGFCYDRHEFGAMLRDAERLQSLGASGVAFGILDKNGRVDVARSREVVEQVAPREAVFHRAFDFVAEPRQALDALITIGCTRVLSGGGQPTARDGAAALAELIRQSAGRIEVMPGGGINAENVGEIVRLTGCNQVHVGASGQVDDGSIARGSSINLCDRHFMEGAAHRALVGELVAATAAALGR